MVPQYFFLLFLLLFIVHFGGKVEQLQIFFSVFMLEFFAFITRV